MNFIKKNWLSILLILSGAMVLLFGIATSFYDELFNFKFYSLILEIDAVLGIALILRLFNFACAVLSILIGFLGLFNILTMPMLSKALLIISAIIQVLMIVLLFIAGQTPSWAYFVLAILTIILVILSMFKDKIIKE